MEKRFVGKTVVITGASGGIGAAMAKRFVAEGANVVVSAIDRRVEQVAQDLRDAGGKVMASVMDVTSKEQVEQLYDLTEKQFGAVDISIQNCPLESKPALLNLGRVFRKDSQKWIHVEVITSARVLLIYFSLFYFILFIFI